MANQTEGRNVLTAIKEAWNRAVRKVTKPLAHFIKKTIEKRRRRRDHNGCPSSFKEQTQHNISDTNLTKASQNGFVEVEKIDDTDLPCNIYEAEGLQLFKNVEKGLLIQTDTYIRHVRLSGKDLARTLIWTDKRLVVITPSLKIKWQKNWNQIYGLPRLYCYCKDAYEQQLTINYREPESVFAPHWNYLTMKLVLRKDIIGKLLQVKPCQPEVNKFFTENNLIRFCSPSSFEESFSVDGHNHDNKPTTN